MENPFVILIMEMELLITGGVMTKAGLRFLVIKNEFFIILEGCFPLHFFYSIFGNIIIEMNRQKPHK
ncbi:MAG: hypothetical protein EA411_00100 [Saprospirales bacterium]|nr:MAG: hypothetical protein EA411_00100 [Saprospirales bacterium]